MKKIKETLKKLLILYLIIYIAFSSMSSAFARGYDDQCGEYVSNYAKDFIGKYGSNSTYVLNTWPTWSGGSFGNGTLNVCCSSGVLLMYKEALGIDLTTLGVSCSADVMNVGENDQYWDIIPMSEVKPGDILGKNGHMELAVSNGAVDHANFGSNNPAAVMHYNVGDTFTKAIRLKNSIEVNPAGTVPIGNVDVGEENLSIYDENGFMYSGVAKIEGYQSSKPFGKWIIDMLTQILDYLIGIITLAIRIVIVGWTAVIERLVIDGIVNSVTGVTNQRTDDWQKNPETIDEIDRQAQQQEETEQVSSQATGNPGDENYVSEGMQAIADIGGKVNLNTSSKANVTVENIVYNKIPILDINFFNFESAGGAVVDENGIIYIIKENIAMWYYTFRIIAILIMLLALIYLGLKMAITTIAEKKAVYKRMLVSWLAGFILVFVINYIMYAVISINETFVNWIIPKYEDGTEISLYESVRSLAYSLKASTGFTGMVMYIILVYYALRFLLVYFKRYLTIMVLAIISPFVAVMYAIQKITHNGKGGETYGRWFKDFIYTVLLQSMHALIYTIFIQIILKLTQTSLVGIALSFFFLNFMIKVDPIIRDIFGLSRGNNASKLSITPLATQIATAKSVYNKYGKNIVGGYLNTMSKLGNATIGKLASKTSLKVNELKDNYLDNKYSVDIPDAEERRKKIQEKEKEKQKKKEEIAELAGEVVTGLKLGKDITLATAKGVLSIPMFIVEPNLGSQVLASAMSSGKKVSKTLKDFKLEPTTLISTASNMGQRFTLKGIVPKNRKAAKKLQSRLRALGINYSMQEAFTKRKKSTNTTNKEIKRENKQGINRINLNEGTRKEIINKIKINNLKLATGGKDIEVLMRELEADGRSGTEKILSYAELLAQARSKEQEIQQQFKELTGQIDEQIIEMQGINPEFAKVLQAKKEKQLLDTSKILTKPLSHKDIYKAMENYKAKVPAFELIGDMKLSKQDAEGITKEIDKILKEKGQDIQMSKEFVKKVEKELAISRKSLNKENESREKSVDTSETIGKDISPDPTKRVANEEVNSLEENDTSMKTSYNENTSETKKRNMRDNNNSLTQRLRNARLSNETNNPHANESINAPKQNSTTNSHDIEKNSSIDRLVQGIQKASKGTDSKTTNTTPRSSIYFAKKLEELEKLNEKAVEISGEEIYDIDTIIEKLKSL